MAATPWTSRGHSLVYHGFSVDHFYRHLSACFVSPFERMDIPKVYRWRTYMRPWPNQSVERTGMSRSARRTNRLQRTPGLRLGFNAGVSGAGSLIRDVRRNLTTAVQYEIQGAKDQKYCDFDRL
jgi:hypothetical protein